MDIRRFVVTGEHSSPTAFESHVYEMLRTRELLEVMAQNVSDTDDSIVISPPEKFVFRIRETHHDPFFWINVSTSHGHYVRIDATDGSVAFDIYPF